MDNSYKENSLKFDLDGLYGFLSGVSKTAGDFLKNSAFGKNPESDAAWLKLTEKKIDEYLHAFKNTPLGEAFGEERQVITDTLKGIKDITGRAFDGMKNTSVGEDIGKNLKAISNLADTAEGRIKKIMDAFGGNRKNTAGRGTAKGENNFFSSMDAMKNTVETTLAGLAEEDAMAIKKHIKSHLTHLNKESKLAMGQAGGQVALNAASNLSGAAQKAAAEGDIFTLIETAVKEAASALLTLGGTYAKYALQKSKHISDVVSRVSSDREKSVTAPGQPGPAPTKDMSPGPGR